MITCRLLIALLFLNTGNLYAQLNADILIKNGKIIDGTGNNWYFGDIAVANDKIIYIGKSANIQATKIIDAGGLVVAPGFIDVHGHIESGIISNPAAANYIYDGVTTVITGNCGGSAADINGFLAAIDSLRPAINVATLVGHNTVRNAIMKHDNRKPSAEEQTKMEALVETALQQGAVGISTGLIYVPGTYAETGEVVGLAKAAARHNGIYVSHIRNEGNSVMEAINEAIDIGRQASIPVQISHFKISSRALWGRSSETIGLVDAARREGWDVTIDQYPYTASSTTLSIRLPDWAFAGGQDSLIYRLENPQIRKQIKSSMLDKLKQSKFKDYSFAMVANYPPDTSYNGKSISEINRMLGRKSKASFEAETIMDMVKTGRVQMVYHTMSEEDVQRIMKYPYTMVGADAGVPTPGSGMPHPRGYGTNARVLGRYVREQQTISLEDAIRRMTSLAASRFGLTDRGMLKEGMAADIVIFDPATVTDKATFEQPHAYSSGFRYVLVNGQLTIDNDQQTTTRSGKALRKRS